MQEKNKRINSQSEDRKGIFICGAGPMQVPLVRIAREMGLNTICADGNAQAAAAGLCDRFCHIDLKNSTKIASVVAGFARRGIIHGVMTAATDFSLLVAIAAENAGLPGLSPQTALNASDKGRMRAVFRESGVPSPAFVLIHSPEEAEKPDGLSWPLVVKPVDNMGARGIRLISSDQELTQAVQEAFRFSRSGTVIIEEYIDGPEFSIDALVYRGKITVCGIADRHIFFPPYFIEMGHTIPSSFSAARLAEITAVFSRGVKALGIDNGAAKGDIKLGKNGPVVGEIAARLSGGYMSGWTYPYSSGLEVSRGAIKIALGEDPGSLVPLCNAVSAERAWISIPGEVRRVSGLRAAGHGLCVKDVLPRAAAGDRVVFPRNNVEKCGNVISAALDRQDAVSAAEEAVRKVRISLKAGDSETAQFLFGDHFLPWAFSEAAFREMNAKTAGPTQVPTELPRPLRFSPVLPQNSKSLGVLKDWHGMLLKDTLDDLYKEPYYCPEGGLALAGVFWKALFRGGWQGADWLARTLLTARSADELKEMLAQWQ
ncbi:MAG: ATP-grasp domain-containing protein [Spirochaetales bacterium]|nr:ATP-grasp domain-containing protein [Spirochaetales bacterium]